jgi:aspartyl-tRNA(Asn)/glutamyl-tRNA(Gln) amidotransferase subunit C
MTEEDKTMSEIITVEEVQKVADLARLEIDEQEVQELTNHLARILAYIDKLNELDTTDVPPTSHVLRIKNDPDLKQGVVKPDEVKPSYRREIILKTAPSATEGYFEVLKVIE